MEHYEEGSFSKRTMIFAFPRRILCLGRRTGDRRGCATCARLMESSMAFFR